MRALAAALLALVVTGIPAPAKCQSMDCWTNCSDCKSRCRDRNCRDMCENINRVCCGAAGKRPYLSGCGCHAEGE